MTSTAGRRSGSAEAVRAPATRKAKQTKAHEIQQALAADIVHGRLLPGSSLDETAMAHRFGVSRTPIREAIRQLEVAGLVDTLPHRGAVVAVISDEQLDDMFSVMAELEALCARWSARAMNGEERRRLHEIYDHSATLVQEGNRELYVAANDRFHSALYDGAHSAYLAEITRSVRIRLAPFRRVQFEHPMRLAKSFHEHGRVLAAIDRADAEEAESQMRSHIGVVRNAVDMVTLPHGPPRAGVRGKSRRG